MKRMLSIALAVIMSCTALAVNVFADHFMPGENGQICNVTTRQIVHSKHIGAVVIDAHEMPDGTMCYVTGLTMEHTVKCTECGYIYEKYNKRCTISHSACGYYYKNCFKE